VVALDNGAFIEIECKVGEYTIRVRGKDAEAIFAEIRNISEKLEVKTRKATGTGGPSLTEFVNSTNPQSDLDRALCCALFLQVHRSLESITTKDVKDAYREAKLPKSTNMSEAIAKNIDKGFMAPTGKQKDGLKSYYVTTPGEKYVNSGFKTD